MGKSDFLWGLEISDTLTMSLVSQMTIFALGLAAICFICNLAYNYLKHGASQLLDPNENKFPDLMEIARCMVLFFCLMIYAPIAKTIVGTLEVLNEATSLTSGTSQEFEQYLEHSFSQQKDLLDEKDKKALENEVEAATELSAAAQKELNEKIEDMGDKDMNYNIAKIARFLNPTTLATSLLHGVFALLAAIIQVIILGMSVVIIKILVILGPFVFAVSMLPVFQRQLSHWFGTLCSAGIVFTVVNILNHILWQVFKNIFEASQSFPNAAVNELETLAIDIVMIGAYCSSFWLASKIVGKADAGRIISKTMSILTSAAALAMLGATGGASGAATNTNVARAAAAGSSVIAGNDKK